MSTAFRITSMMSPKPPLHLQLASAPGKNFQLPGHAHLDGRPEPQAHDKTQLLIPLLSINLLLLSQLPISFNSPPTSLSCQNGTLTSNSSFSFTNHIQLAGSVGSLSETSSSHWHCQRPNVGSRSPTGLLQQPHSLPSGLRDGFVKYRVPHLPS